MRERGLCFKSWAYYDAYRRLDGEIMSNTTSNFDSQSLRGFLQMVEADYPDELLRIRQPVDTRFDMTAIVFELERAGKSPVVIFETSESQRHAGRHQCGREPQAARGLSRRRSRQPADRVSRALPEIHPLRGGQERGVAGHRDRRRCSSTCQSCRSRCSSRSMADPTSPPARFRRAIQSPVSTPPAFTG